MPNQNSKWFPKKLEDDSMALVGKIPNISKLLNKEGETLAEAGGSAVAHNDLVGRDVANSHPATAVSYNNTESGLTATNVKSAIDEMAQGLSPEFLVTQKIFVDKNSSASSENQDGSFSKPFSSIATALTHIETLITARIAGSETRTDCKYIVEVAPETYTGDLVIPACAFLQLNIEGVTIDGNITREVTQVGFDATYYYSKVVFYGGSGKRAEKGKQSVILGNYTTNTSEGLAYLHYTTMQSVNFEGNIVTTNGVSVIGLFACSFYNSSSSITGTGATLLEVFNGTRIKQSLSGDVSLYNAYDSEISGDINTTPTTDSRILNCEFGGSINITGSTLSLDSNSYKSFTDASPTGTYTINLLDVASGIKNDSTVKGENVKNALENLENAIQTDEESGSILDYASGIKQYSSTASGTGNKPKDVFVSGRFAYQLQHENPGFLIIWDIQDPYNPVKKGTLSINNGPNSIEVKDDIAYIGCNTGRLYVVDVSNPDNPTTLSSNQFGGTSQKFDIAVHATQDIVAMADATGNGLYLIDVSNPTAPTQVYNTAFNAGGVAIEGNLLYVTDYSSSAVRVYDISTPATPTLEVTHSVGSMVVSIGVKDSIAYVGEYSTSNMYVVDFITTASPVLKDTLTLSGAPTNEGSASRQKDNLLYIFTSNGNIEIYNVEDLDNIIKVTQYSLGHAINGGDISKAHNSIVIPDNGVNRLTLLGDIRSDVLASDIITRRARYFHHSDMGSDDASFATKKYVDDNDASDKSFEQSFTDTETVNVAHNLGKYPSSIILDTAGYEMVGTIQHTDKNNLIVTFVGNQSGTITCN